MRELNIEERLFKIEENITIIRRMLEELLNRRIIETKQDDDKAIMTVKQVAQFLDLDVNIIYEKCARGDIPYFRLGKRYRFKKVDIIGWLNGHTKGPDISIDEYVNRYMQKHMMRS